MLAKVIIVKKDKNNCSAMRTVNMNKQHTLQLSIPCHCYEYCEKSGKCMLEEPIKAPKTIMCLENWGNPFSFFSLNQIKMAAFRPYNFNKPSLPWKK